MITVDEGISGCCGETNASDSDAVRAQDLTPMRASDVGLASLPSYKISPLMSPLFPLEALTLRINRCIICATATSYSTTPIYLGLAALVLKYKAEP